MGTAVNRGPRGADGCHLYDTAASFSPLSPTLLLPHWPYCHTCPAHTGPRAFALSAGVSAWNERSSSSCGTAGQVLLSRSQLKCQPLSSPPLPPQPLLSAPLPTHSWLVPAKSHQHLAVYQIPVPAMFLLLQIWLHLTSVSFALTFVLCHLGLLILTLGFFSP